MNRDNTASCRSCGSPVVWIETIAWRRMPLDPEVLTIVDDKGVTHRGRLSHFATCPNADQHRRRSNS